MVRMGQYRSRRQPLTRRRRRQGGGGIKFDDVVRHGKAAVKFIDDNPELVSKVAGAGGKVVKHLGGSLNAHNFARNNPALSNLMNDVAFRADHTHETSHHPTQHAPSDLLNVAQNLYSQAPEMAHGVLRDHHSYPQPPPLGLINPFTTQYPDHSVDPMAEALAVRKEHWDANVGGALDFGALTKATNTLVETFNPESTVDNMMGNFDRVNLQDTSARGIAKNGLNLYAANLRGHAAYAQTTGLALTPAVALGAAVPMVGLHATAQGFKYGAKGVDAINRHI